ncbi:MAG: YceI family protein [Longimicrobiales bacterium]
MSSTPAVTTTGTSTWTLDASHSSVAFAVRHMMIANVRGHFADFTGTVEIDGDDYVSAEIAADIDVSSITTRNNQRDEHLRSADFFDAAAFPKMTFASTKVEAVTGESVKVHGDLTIRGNTRPVTVDVTIDGRGMDPWGGERMSFTAETKISRSAFGMTWSQAMETGGVLVGDEIRITIEGELIRQ